LRPLGSSMLHQEAFFISFFQIRPSQVLELPVRDVISMLRDHFGSFWDQAVNPSAHIPSPVRQEISASWIKRAKCVGINVRTIDHFWNIIPYALTLPKAQNAIHILPVWEPGVVGSLYGMSSWKINPEFFSGELAQELPQLNSVEKQLKVVVNILHLMGKTVGMDVVPHTDRFSEQVLANPGCFEWLQRDDLVIVRQEEHLSEAVQQQIFYCLQEMGSATPLFQLPDDAVSFYSRFDENQRCLMLFGPPDDYWGRLERRKTIIQWLYQQGLETVPATMAPPYRGLEVDPHENAMVIDEDGRSWRDFRITQPEAMSRVFGPLTRYKLYGAKDDNKYWELDFNRPINAVWEYVCQHYHDIQRTYGFDFMRGDMSHVQMRPDGVPAQPDACYDLLGAVKMAVQKESPWFGYFAESFMAPPGEMAYGDEYDHLEASFADTTLGDLQSEPVGTDLFVKEFARYRQVLETRKFAPNFTVMTADKDDPRFDRFYLKGNEIRYFIALFLPDMPSYMALGFECRDPHPFPAANEYYTKLYVFQEKKGPKSTKGPYLWGNNNQLYAQLGRQKLMSAEINEAIHNVRVEWLMPPDPEGIKKVIGWSAGGYVFFANLDTVRNAPPIALPAGMQILFSTQEEVVSQNRFEPSGIILFPGEGIILNQQMEG
jgi:hypothetical protein